MTWILAFHSGTPYTGAGITAAVYSPDTDTGSTAAALGASILSCPKKTTEGTGATEWRMIRRRARPIRPPCLPLRGSQPRPMAATATGGTGTAQSWGRSSTPIWIPPAGPGTLPGGGHTSQRRVGNSNCLTCAPQACIISEHAALQILAQRLTIIEAGDSEATGLVIDEKCLFPSTRYAQIGEHGGSVMKECCSCC